ncbi:MAG: tetratricopeptide repeat protein, partial [Paramuribaculum sp.]|nr:tetratricopeptide repeat protein [Paramuribaculum sp.]
MKATHIISIIIACTFTACTTRHDPRVESLFSLAESAPEAALDSIAALDSLDLSSTDRMLVRLAAIKATDKADRQLPDDTEILPLVDYYSSHETDSYYPTALYYAGRIYSESGDYPTALRYFQDALDLLPENTPQLKLRGCVLSQTGAILSDLRLYDEAEPYYTEVLEIDLKLQDTINMIYDLENLSYLNRKNGDYKKAIKVLLYSNSLSQKTFPNTLSSSLSSLAFSYYKAGNIGKALELLKDLNPIGSKNDTNATFSTLCTIYHHIGNQDSTFKYATKLAAQNDEYYKRNGYYYLLQKGLKDFVPKDSIYCYVTKYLDYSENILKQNSNHAALIQNSYYNYTLHDRKRRHAEKTKDNMIVITLALAVLVCLLIIVALYYKYRSQLRKIKLNEALENIRILKAQLQELTETKTQDNANDKALALKDKLRKQLIEAASATTGIYSVPTELAATPIYAYLKNKINNKEPLPDKFSWIKLQEAIDTAFQEWKQSLRILAGTNFKPDTIKTILLV